MNELQKGITISFSNRRITQFMIILLLWALVEGMTTFYMPLFVQERVGDLALVGLFFAANSFSSTTVDLLFGFVTEVTDYRKFFYIGGMIYLLMIPLFIWGQGWLAILLLVILWGAQFELFYRFGTGVFIAKHSPHQEFEAVTSTSFMMRNLGFFAGPILADYLRINVVSLIPMIMLILVLLMLFNIYLSFSNNTGHQIARKARHLSLVSEVQIIRRHFRKVLPHLVLGFGVGSVEAIMLVYGTIYFTERTDIAGLIVGLSLLMNVLVPPVAILVFRRLGAKMTIGLATLFCSLFILTFGMVVGELMLLLISVSVFATVATMWVINDSIFMRMLSRIKHDEEDEIVSISGLGPNIAYALVVLFGGVVMQQFGFEKTALLGIAVLLVCIGCFLLLYKQPRRKIT